MKSQVKHRAKFIITIIVLTSFLPIFSAVALSNSSYSSQKKHLPMSDYDPHRDATQDLKQAISEARRTKKNIILEVGGQWCVWCHIMDQFFQQNPDILRLRESNYITVKINFSPENENKEILSQYPHIPGYPHLFVLDSSGKLIHSQFTGVLEKGMSYDREKVISFLKKWGPTQ